MGVRRYVLVLIGLHRYVLARSQSIGIVAVGYTDVLLFVHTAVYGGCCRNQVPTLTPVHGPAGTVVIADGVAGGGGADTFI